MHPVGASWQKYRRLHHSDEETSLRYQKNLETVTVPLQDEIGDHD